MQPASVALVHDYLLVMRVAEHADTAEFLGRVPDDELAVTTAPNIVLPEVPHQKEAEPPGRSQVIAESWRRKVRGERPR
jgi:hypothetical protein